MGGKVQQVLHESLVFICQENPKCSGILLFADHPRFCQYIGYLPEVCSRFLRNVTFICDRGTGAQQFRGLVMSLVFIFPRWSGILLFPNRPRFCRLMKTRNCRYPRSSGMNGDKSDKSENLNLNHLGCRRPSAIDFAHYQSPKLLGTSSPITNKRIVSRKSGTDLWRISDISAKSGTVSKK